MNRDKKYLITGGTGTLGRALISRLLKNGFNNLVALSRNEGRLIGLKKQFPLIEIVPGDIADPYICEKACKNIDGIFHLAAFKHIGLAELNVHQCIQSNVIGTLNLLNETLKNHPELFIFISTDKASNVSGVYGATKFLGEKLIKEFSKVNLKTKYRMVRYGNIWNSTGSFITKWKPLMKGGKEIILTDPKATRFFFTTDNAVSSIFKCIEESKDVKPFIPDMKSVSMGTVLEACQDVYGKCPVKVIGLQAGENLHETLDGKIFSNQVEQYTKEEFIKEYLKDAL